MVGMCTSRGGAVIDVLHLGACMLACLRDCMLCIKVWYMGVRIRDSEIRMDVKILIGSVEGV